MNDAPTVTLDAPAILCRRCGTPREFMRTEGRTATGVFEIRYVALECAGCLRREETRLGRRQFLARAAAAFSALVSFGVLIWNLLLIQDPLLAIASGATIALSIAVMRVAAPSSPSESPAPTETPETLHPRRGVRLQQTPPPTDET